MESLVDEFLKPQETQNINKATTPHLVTHRRARRRSARCQLGPHLRRKPSKSEDKRDAPEPQEDKSKPKCYQQNGGRRDPSELETDGTAR